MSFEQFDNTYQHAVLKVVGIGDGGCNAVENMQLSGLELVDYVVINTDAEAIKKSEITESILIGTHITKGLSAGANPDIGRQAAMEDRDRIEEMLNGADMIFITAGMGGGTGTGGAPIVAKVAKELGILTVAVVTMPFPFEGKKRMEIAEKGVEELKKYVDSLITISNEKLLTVLGKQISLLDAFKAANDELLGAVQGIADLITRPGLINVDFADVRTVMSETGMAMMGSGTAKGEERAREAAERAVHSLQLDDCDLSMTRGILVNVTAGLDMAIGEFEAVGNTIKEFASENSIVVVGTVIDPELSDELRVTVVATGLGKGADELAEQPVKLPPNKEQTVDTNLEYLDMPAFLRNQVSDTSEVHDAAFRSVKLVANESVPDEELAELLVHLSNVYKSVGGDELIVQAVGRTPPGSELNSKSAVAPARRAAR